MSRKKKIRNENKGVTLVVWCEIIEVWSRYLQGLPNIEKTTVIKEDVTK